MFSETPLEIFGHNARKIGKIKAILIVLNLSTTYLYEKRFSTMLNLKTSKIKKLQTDYDLRIALCKIVQDGVIV